MSMRRPQAFAKAANLDSKVARVGNLHMQDWLFLLIKQLICCNDQGVIVRRDIVNDPPGLTLVLTFDLGTIDEDVDHVGL